MPELLNLWRTWSANDAMVFWMLVAAAALLAMCLIAFAKASQMKRRLGEAQKKMTAELEQAAAARQSIAELLSQLERILPEMQRAAEEAPAESIAEPVRVEIKPAVGLPRRDPTLDPLTQDVYHLADQGYAPVQIAQELNEHIGKVELILALRAI